MMKNQASFQLIVMLAFTLLWQHMATAFNVDTHEAMNESATRNSTLDTFLKTAIGMEDGVNDTFRSLTVTQWTEEGGHDEDNGTRPLRHFHDPLQSWSDAGLQTVPSAPRLESSVLWMQEDDGADAGTGQQKWSWPDARRSYRDALTSRLPGDRDQRWADTFRAIGHIMHLIEDAGQPAHVRNDPHGLELICRDIFGIRCGGNFEYWVSENSAAYSLDGAPQLDTGMLHEATSSPSAPVPVAHLIDNDIYIGSSANVTLGPHDENNDVETMTAPVGIAEFTNANFSAKIRRVSIRTATSPCSWTPPRWRTTACCADT